MGHVVEVRNALLVSNLDVGGAPQVEPVRRGRLCCWWSLSSFLFLSECPYRLRNLLVALL